MSSLVKLSVLQQSIFGCVQASEDGVSISTLRERFCKGKSYIARAAIDNLATNGLITIKDDCVHWSGKYPTEV